jgi:hypothetical protein
MQQYAKTLKFALVGAVGTVGSVLLTLAMVQFATPSAEATPAMARGKACKTCHTSSKPSKTDVKKKRSEIWFDEQDIIVAHLFSAR